jgi:hypothetical protein
MLLWIKKYTEINAVIDRKYKIYKTLIRPVVLYGCESWTVTKTDEGKLSIFFERKILRKIYGPIVTMGYGE